MLQYIIGAFLWLVSGPLWRLGGWGTEGQYPNPVPWTGWRDTVIPILCGLWFGLFSKNWLIGLLSLVTALIVRLGYGPTSIFMKGLRLTDVQARTLCGLLYGFIAFLPITIYTQDWYTYLGLTLLLGLVNWFVVQFNIKDIATDLSIGWTFGLAFLFYIK